MNLKKKAANSWNYATASGNALLIILAAIAFIALIALIVLWPWIIIWAINGLFDTGIEYTFWTWLQAAILIGMVHHTSSTSSK